MEFIVLINFEEPRQTKQSHILSKRVGSEPDDEAIT